MDETREIQNYIDEHRGLDTVIESALNKLTRTVPELSENTKIHIKQIVFTLLFYKSKSMTFNTTPPSIETSLNEAGVERPKEFIMLLCAQILLEFIRSLVV